MALHRALQAAKNGDLQTLRSLQAGGSLAADIADSQGATLVHYTARTGKLDCLKFLVAEANFPGNKKARNGASPAHDAAATGNLMELQWLIGRGGCHIQDPDASGASVLHLAARFGRCETVRWLLEAGCDAMMETESGAIPAHYAAAKGDLTCLKLLVTQAPRSGMLFCCASVRFFFSFPPMNLMHVKEPSFYSISSRVYAREPARDEASFTGIDLSAQDNEGATALHFAARAGHFRILERLLRMGAKSITDYWGGTPLHDAAENGELECCQFLILSKVLPGLRDQDGYMAGDLAEYNGHSQCAKYLRTAEKLPIPENNSPILLAQCEGKENERKPKTTSGKQAGAGDYYRSLNEGHRESGDLSGSAGNGQNPVTVQPSSPPPFAPPLPPQGEPFLASQQESHQTLETNHTNPKASNMTAGVKSFNMVKPTEESKMLVTELKAGKSLKKAGKLMLTSQVVSSPVRPEKTTKRTEPQMIHWPCPVRHQQVKKVSSGSEQKENGIVPLPVDEVNMVDVDVLVPTHDERGRTIPEWKRQVMVRKLQARLLDEEEQRKKHTGNDYIKMEGWRYSHAHNAILGPFGEFLTEDDLIYLEKQIANVRTKEKDQDYASELDRLAEELRTILPAPIVNITVNTQFLQQNAGKDGHLSLPVWCNRISGIVKSMSLLLTNVNDREKGDHENKISKMPNSELASVFSQRPENRGSIRTREKVEKEINRFGVSVRNLRSNFERQGSGKEIMSPTFRRRNLEGETSAFEHVDVQYGDATEYQQDYIDEKQNVYMTNTEDLEYTSDSGISSEETSADQSTSPAPLTESTSLRKERIVVLFLSHWKKSTYTMSLRTKTKTSDEASTDVEISNVEQNLQKSEMETNQKTQSQQSMENGRLSHFFQQKRTITKLIGNWRNIICHVPSRQLRRLNRQQITYSPEQFLPRVNGAPIDYKSLTLDLFMLGYFHILELDLTRDERKMRHLLCFEVFDHLGRFSWETVREFHKTVIDEIDAGKREWKDGFEDIKQRFFGNSEDSAMAADTTKQQQPIVTRPVPKVIVQSATPEENENWATTDSFDLGNFSNDEICKYIDRSFAFWKEKEAEMFDFEE
nr:PREDICTED: espin-like protein [Latimeria chalumnae]|eukprot:XP_014348184.1 PREDICTED: espin-like protein [Latimeria chalumnae]